MAVNNAPIQIPDRGSIIPPEVTARFDKIDNILIAVVASVIISGIAVVIAVVGLFIDQLRYNNVAYKEYSDKLEERNILIKEYKQQLEKNNSLLEKVITK